jgi:hypothetical protein
MTPGNRQTVGISRKRMTVECTVLILAEANIASER